MKKTWMIFRFSERFESILIKVLNWFQFNSDQKPSSKVLDWSRFSVLIKVLIKVLELTLVLNCCWNFCSNDLNWSQFSVLIKVLIKVLELVAESVLIKRFFKKTDLNQLLFSVLIKILNWIVVQTSAQMTWIGFSSQFWSKGSLKSLIKNKFKILKRFQFSTLIKIAVLNIWEDWVESILIQIVVKALNWFQFSVLIKRFFKKVVFKDSFKKSDQSFELVLIQIVVRMFFKKFCSNDLNRFWSKTLTLFLLIFRSWPKMKNLIWTFINFQKTHIKISKNHSSLNH